MVGERSVVGRRQTGRTAGRGGSENAGMSSEKKGENPFDRKPKDSWVKLVFPGLAGS